MEKVQKNPKFLLNPFLALFFQRLQPRHVRQSCHGYSTSSRYCTALHPAYTSHWLDVFVVQKGENQQGFK